MKKSLILIFSIYAFIAEIIGSFVIIMFVLSLFGQAKFEVSHSDWTRCFGQCNKTQKQEMNNEIQTK